MNIKTRLDKLEQSNKQDELVLIAVDENETNEEAHKRCFSDPNAQPKMIIYASQLDCLL